MASMGTPHTWCTDIYTDKMLIHKVRFKVSKKKDSVFSVGNVAPWIQHAYDAQMCMQAKHIRRNKSEVRDGSVVKSIG